MHYNETARDMDKLKILKAASWKNRLLQNMKIGLISCNYIREQKPMAKYLHISEGNKYVILEFNT